MFRIFSGAMKVLNLLQYMFFEVHSISTIIAERVPKLFYKKYLFSLFLELKHLNINF